MKHSECLQENAKKTQESWDPSFFQSMGLFLEGVVTLLPGVADLSAFSLAVLFYDSVGKRFDCPCDLPLQLNTLLL